MFNVKGIFIFFPLIDNTLVFIKLNYFLFKFSVMGVFMVMTKFVLTICTHICTNPEK